MMIGEEGEEELEGPWNDDWIVDFFDRQARGQIPRPQTTADLIMESIELN